MGKISIIWMVFGLFFLSLSNIYAATIHVPADQPTIQAGINAAANGDTVLVAPGTFIQNINFNGKRIIVTSQEGPLATTIIAADNNKEVISMVNGESKGTEISGFSITGGGRSGVYCMGCSPTIKFNIITGNRSTINNDGGGISLKTTSNSLISNNIIFGNTAESFGPAIHIGDDGMSSTNDTIRNNIMYDNVGQWDIRILGNVNNLMIYNNTIDVRTLSAILHQGNGLVDVRNNIIVNAPFCGIYFAGFSGGIINVEYNCLFNNTSNYYGLQPGPGNILMDPHFIDPSIRDYALGANSPCIDAGDPNPIYNDPDGTRNDIGALYFRRAPRVLLVPSDYPTIQAAIDSSRSGDTVLVAPGTYSGEGFRDMNYDGKGIVVRSSSGPDSTIISVIHEDLYYTYTGFIFENGEDTAAKLEGFTITQTPWAFTYMTGGAIICHNAGPIIRDCKINNQQVAKAGAMDIVSGSPIIIACEFSNNTAGASALNAPFMNVRVPRSADKTNSISDPVGDGGAIYAINSTVNVIKCTFSSNFSDGGSGGAICGYNSILIIDSCEFRSHVAYSNAHDDRGYGGAIAIEGGFASLSNSSFTLNSADVGGGALSLRFCDSSFINDCLFANNYCTDYVGGGAVYTFNAHTAFSGCSFMNNHINSNTDGGAINIANSFSAYDNCIFSGNNTNNGNGGAASITNSSCVFAYCTFYGNYISRDVGNGEGGTIYSDSDPHFDNCIISYSSIGSAFYCSDPLKCPVLDCCNIYGNIEGDWTGCIADQLGVRGNISLNPAFCNAGAGDFTIYNSSPCAPANNSCGVLIGALGIGCVFQGVTAIHLENDTALGHILNHTPMISWNYEEPNGYPQTQYEIAVGTDSDWAFSEMWNPAPVASADTFVTYAGTPLVDGATYYLRLRVHNGSVWSLWYDTTFRMNSVPSVPVLTWPDSGAIVNTATPTLYVHNATDAENDTLTYEFSITNHSMWGPPQTTTGTNVPSGVDSTGWTVSSPLNENWQYIWKARCFDGYEYSAWTPYGERSNLYVNAIEESPWPFELVKPPDTAGNIVFNMLPYFFWGISIDADPLDSVRYTLYLSLDSNFQFVQTIEIPENQYTPTDSLFFGTRYWWKVKATDETGRFTYSTDVHNFRTWKLGDANGDWLANIQDVTFLINFLYNKIPPGPVPKYVGDVNGDCLINIKDITYLINYLYKGGPAPKIGCM